MPITVTLQDGVLGIDFGLRFGDTDEDLAGAFSVGTPSGGIIPSDLTVSAYPRTSTAYVPPSLTVDGRGPLLSVGIGEGLQRFMAELPLIRLDSTAHVYTSTPQYVARLVDNARRYYFQPNTPGYRATIEASIREALAQSGRGVVERDLIPALEALESELGGEFVSGGTARMHSVVVGSQRVPALSMYCHELLRPSSPPPAPRLTPGEVMDRFLTTLTDLQGVQRQRFLDSLPALDDSDPETREVLVRILSAVRGDPSFDRIAAADDIVSGLRSYYAQPESGAARISILNRIRLLLATPDGRDFVEATLLPQMVSVEAALGPNYSYIDEGRPVGLLVGRDARPSVATEARQLTSHPAFTFTSSALQLAPTRAYLAEVVNGLSRVQLPSPYTVAGPMTGGAGLISSFTTSPTSGPFDHRHPDVDPYTGDLIPGQSPNVAGAALVVGARPATLPPPVPILGLPRGR